MNDQHSLLAMNCFLVPDKQESPTKFIQIMFGVTSIWRQARLEIPSHMKRLGFRENFMNIFHAWRLKAFDSFESENLSKPESTFPPSAWLIHREMLFAF